MFRSLFSSDNDDGDFDPRDLPPELREMMDKLMQGGNSIDDLPYPFRNGAKAQATEESRRRMNAIASMQVGILTMFGNDEEIVAAWEADDDAATALAAVRSVFERRIDLGGEEADNHHYSAFMCGIYGLAVRAGLVNDKEFDLIDYHDEGEHTHLPGRVAIDKRTHRLRTAVREAFIRVQRDGRLTTIDDKPFELWVESDGNSFDRVLTYNGDAFGTAAPIGSNMAWAIVGEGGKLSTPEGEPFTLMVSFDKGETYEPMVKLDKAVTTEEEVRFVNIGSDHAADSASSTHAEMSATAQKIAEALKKDGLLNPADNGKAEIFVTNLKTGEKFELTEHGLEPRMEKSAEKDWSADPLTQNLPSSITPEELGKITADWVTGHTALGVALYDAIEAYDKHKAANNGLPQADDILTVMRLLGEWRAAQTKLDFSEIVSVDLTDPDSIRKFVGVDPAAGDDYTVIEAFDDLRKITDEDDEKFGSSASADDLGIANDD